MNQDITFLSDGGDTVRDLQLYLRPPAEHLLDWFHITMRVTVMKQMANGIPRTDLVDLEAEIDLVCALMNCPAAETSAAGADATITILQP